MQRFAPVALLLIPLLVPTASAQEQPPPFLTVSGNSEVSAEPDEALVRLGVEEEATEARAAQDQASRIAGAILAAWREIGIAEDAIQTSTLRLMPIYEQLPRGSVRRSAKVVAYRASNELSVRLRDLAQVGPAIDAAIGAGANRVSGLDFRLRNDLEMRRRALSQAVAEARAKATTIAEALGVELGPVLEVQEGGVSVQPIRYGAAQMMRMQAVGVAADTPVAAGNVEINASVQVRFRLAE